MSKSLCYNVFRWWRTGVISRKSIRTYVRTTRSLLTRSNDGWPRDSKRPSPLSRKAELLKSINLALCINKEYRYVAVKKNQRESEIPRNGEKFYRTVLMLQEAVKQRNDEAMSCYTAALNETPPNVSFSLNFLHLQMINTYKVFSSVSFRCIVSRSVCRNFFELCTKIDITRSPTTNICWTAAWNKPSAKSQPRLNTWRKSIESPIRVSWC